LGIQLSSAESRRKLAVEQGIAPAGTLVPSDEHAGLNTSKAVSAMLQHPDVVASLITGINGIHEQQRSGALTLGNALGECWKWIVVGASSFRPNPNIAMVAPHFLSPALGLPVRGRDLVRLISHCSQRSNPSNFFNDVMGALQEVDPLRRAFVNVGKRPVGCVKELANTERSCAGEQKGEGPGNDFINAVLIGCLTVGAFLFPFFCEMAFLCFAIFPHR
jgi:hypothetical protein